MKISTALNVILAAAILFLSVKLAGKGDTENPAVAESNSTAVIDNILTRTSIRDFQDKPVEDEKIEQLLRAAMAAPTAVNKQPWRFIVVKDKNTLKSIAENFRTMTMLEKAPLAIIVCGDKNAFLGGDSADYWIQDASAATENLLLAAHALDLGAVWCGVYPRMERVEQLREMLAIPDSIIPLNVIPVGYPAESPEPKDKWHPDYIHYETWAGTSPSLSFSQNVPTVKEWKEIEPQAFNENPFRLFSSGLALSVGNREKMNAMAIGWGGLGVLWGRDRPVVTVYVRRDRFTHEFMEDNDYFVVEGFSRDYDDKISYLGSTSGRDEDKMTGSGLTIAYTEQGTPYFDEGNVLFVCKKIYGAPFNSEGFGEYPSDYYRDKPLHSIYIGQIERIMVKR